MKIIKQTDKDNRRLLLFFSGWGASPELFGGMAAEEGTDVMICYDYREIAFDEDLSRYEEIHLVAWSMGVRMAELTLAGRYKPASATAINGTSCPIHDTYGIPEKIFRGTLDNLTSDGFHRFNRRMCGTRELLAHYQTVAARPLDQVRDELQAIYDRCAPASADPESRQPLSAPSPAPVPIAWTRALVGDNDRIFPPANQLAWWNSRCPVTRIPSPHYPFHLWKRWNEL